MPAGCNCRKERKWAVTTRDWDPRCTAGSTYCVKLEASARRQAASTSQRPCPLPKAIRLTTGLLVIKGRLDYIPDRQPRKCGQSAAEWSWDGEREASWAKDFNATSSLSFCWPSNPSGKSIFRANEAFSAAPPIYSEKLIRFYQLWLPIRSRVCDAMICCFWRSTLESRIGWTSREDWMAEIRIAELSERPDCTWNHLTPFSIVVLLHNLKKNPTFFYFQWRDSLALCNDAQFIGQTFSTHWARSCWTKQNIVD